MHHARAWAVSDVKCLYYVNDCVVNVTCKRVPVRIAISNKLMSETREVSLEELRWEILENPHSHCSSHNSLLRIKGFAETNF